MSEPAGPPELETDPRFPSGPWIGFYLQRARPGRHRMELSLYFRDGRMWGDGRDQVGRFLIRGRYELESGKARWSKRYAGKHDVGYDGFNEGKGIWGRWEIPPGQDPDFERGGFHIWPKGMHDPSNPSDREAADLERSLEERPSIDWSETEVTQPDESLVPIGKS